jgi:hypothetical protein
VTKPLLSGRGRQRDLQNSYRTGREAICQPAQTMIMFMIKVIISADGRVPRGQKNMTKHDKA